MMLRDMAESVLRDDERLGDILIAADSAYSRYKVIANEIDALDKLLFYRPAFVYATLRSGGDVGAVVIRIREQRRGRRDLLDPRLELLFKYREQRTTRMVERWGER